MTTKKIALITGTSTGIGFSTAITLAKANYHVIATMRDLNKSKLLQQQAEEGKLPIDIQLLDVQDDASVQQVIDSTIDRFGTLDILVNNAGVGYVGTTETTSVDDLKRVMDVNLYGVWRVTKAVLPYMRKAKSGRIVTVSSIGGIIGQPFNDAYCAAKFAVEGMMESLSSVVLGMGIHVSLIEPGPVATSFLSNASGFTQTPPDPLQSSPYAAALQAYIANVSERYASIAQTGDDVAAVILASVLSEQPLFRYQTSDFVKSRVADKLMDVTGNTQLQNTAKVLWG